MHLPELKEVCGEKLRCTYLDAVFEACAIAERERWPQLGLSVTRRSLHMVCNRFNDKEIKCLGCFICGQLRTTCSGFHKTDLTEMEGDASSNHQEIKYVTASELEQIGDIFYPYKCHVNHKRLLGLSECVQLYGHIYIYTHVRVQ